MNGNRNDLVEQIGMRFPFGQLVLSANQREPAFRPRDSHGPGKIPDILGTPGPPRSALRGESNMKRFTQDF